MKLRIAAARVVPPRFGTLARCSRGVVGIVMAEAVRTRPGRIGRATKRGQIDTQSIVLRTKNPRRASRILHQVAARQLDYGWKTHVRFWRRNIRDHRPDRWPLEPPRPW